MNQTAGISNANSIQTPSFFRNPVILVCFLVAMIDGFDTLVMSFIAPLISKEWGLPHQAIGKIFAATYAGAAIGATSIGIAADRFGRKALLLFALSMAASFTFISSWSGNPAQLMLCRFLAGIGLGGAIPTISALTASNVPFERRSVAVTRVFVGFPIGAMLGGAITAMVMSHVGWRGVLIGDSLIALLVIPLVLRYVKESSSADPHKAARVHSRHPLVELVSDGRGLGTVLLCAATFLMLLLTYFLVSWTPTVLTLNGVSPQHAALGGAVLNLGGLTGALILSWLIGHKSPLLTIAGCLCGGSVLVAMLGQSVVGIGAIGFVLVFAVGLMIIGAQTNLPALSVYFYPRSVYATGVGLSMAIGRIGSIVGPLLGGYLISAHMGWNQLFMLAAVPAVLAAIAIALIHYTRQRRKQA